MKSICGIIFLMFVSSCAYIPYNSYDPIAVTREDIEAIRFEIHKLQAKNFATDYRLQELERNDQTFADFLKLMGVLEAERGTE